MPRYLAFCWRFCKVIRDGAPTPVPRFLSKLLRSELGQVPTWFWAAAGGRIAEIQVQTLEKHTILSNMKIMCGYVWYEHFCCLILSGCNSLHNWRAEIRCRKFSLTVRWLFKGAENSTVQSVDILLFYFIQACLQSDLQWAGSQNVTYSWRIASIGARFVQKLGHK